MQQRGGSRWRLRKSTGWSLWRGRRCFTVWGIEPRLCSLLLDGLSEPLSESRPLRLSDPMGVELEYYMAKTLDQLIQKSNLALAWKRIQSNSSPNYKNYFRKLYANYAIGETTLLSDLHDRLKRGVYR